MELLTDPRVQSERNFFALARYRLLDSYGMRVAHAEQDRCFCLVGPDVEFAVLGRFDQLERSGDLQQGGAGLHSVPQPLLAACNATRSAVIRGYRGRLPGGLSGDQWIAHRLFANGTPKEMVIEQDVDPESPVDIAGFLPHLVMCFRNWRTKAKTDPFKTAEILRKAGLEA